MFGAYLKKKFGKGEQDVPPSQQFYSPLRIALHSTIEIGMIDWLGYNEQLNKSMKLPFGKMSILAIGKTVVDDSEIYNIYLQDEHSEEFTLQLFCTDNGRGGDKEVTESTLYREVRNVSPLTEEEWTDELHPVGKVGYELDGNMYQRVWSDDYKGKIEMISFDEHIVRVNEELDYVNNYVLYGRELTAPYDGAAPAKEMLLVGVEETDTTAEIVTRIGLPIPPSAITVQ
jgi:hypothetical protein